MVGGAGNDPIVVSAARTNCSEREATRLPLRRRRQRHAPWRLGQQLLEGGLGADGSKAMVVRARLLPQRRDRRAGLSRCEPRERIRARRRATPSTAYCGIQGSIFDDLLVGDARPQLSVGEDGNDTLMGGAGRRRHQRRERRRHSLGRNGRRHARRRRRRQPPDRRRRRGHVRRHRRMERRILRDVHQLGPGRPRSFDQQWRGCCRRQLYQHQRCLRIRTRRHADRQ